jgi:hypothetical protein
MAHSHTTDSMMSLALTHRTASQGRLRDVLMDAGRNVLRWILLGLGIILVIFGIIISPLPGPGGLPVTVLGLMLVLRNSFAARRIFIRVQRRHTKMIFPLRRLLRREPEVFPVAWQQALRIERMILPKGWRKGAELRRKYFRR